MTDQTSADFRAWIEQQSRPRTLADLAPRTAIMRANDNPAHDVMDAHLRGLAGRGTFTQDAFTGRQLKEPEPAPQPPANAAEAAALAAGLPATAGPLLVGTTAAELADSANALARWHANNNRQ